MVRNFLIFIGKSIITFNIGVMSLYLYYKYHSFFYLICWVSVAPFIIYLFIEEMDLPILGDLQDLPIGLARTILDYKSLNKKFFKSLIWPLLKYIFYVFIIPLICFYLHEFFQVDIFFIIGIIYKIITIYLSVFIFLLKQNNNK